jgi:type I restriction enzyme S subunit
VRGYSKYKDSGVEWLGNVPEQWRVLRIKSTVDSALNGVWGDDPKGDENDVVCIRVADFNYDTLSVSEEKLTLRNIPTNQLNSREINKGDILLEKSGGGELFPVGRAVIYDLSHKAVNSNFISTIKIRAGISSKFVLYCFQSLYSKKVNTRSIKQTTGIQNLDSESYFDEIIALPSPSEQAAIVSFLDTKTSQIDTLIRNKQKLIELLKEERAAIINQAVTKGIDPNVKMKDSGVEWLGEIAEAWNYVAVKHLVEVKVTDGPHETPDFLEVGVPFASAESVVDGKIDFNRIRGHISQEDHERYSLKCKPQRGDVFIVKSGSTTGKVAYVDFDKEFNIWSPLALIRTNDKLDSRFAFYAFSADYFQTQIKLFWSFGTQPNIGMNMLENLRVAVPGRREQSLIVATIESSLGKIDGTIDAVNKEINLLQEYRTALISEVVTGKVCVI